MRPFRFVHAADLHLDSPFTGLKEAAPEIATRLQQATFDAFRNLVGLCLEERVDFLVVAGDVYDGADRSVRAQLRFRDGLAELAQAGIPTYIVHGNHDPLDGWQSSIDWPEGVHSFGPIPEWRIVHARGEPVAQIQGVSYRSRDVTENLAATFTAPPRSDLFSIGLLHCNLGNDPNHPNYAPCSLDDLRSKQIDYWALGHVHTRAARSVEETTVVYPGNLQGRHPNERGARGAYLVDANESRSVRLDFRPLDVVRWELAEVHIRDLETLDALRDRLRETADRLSEGADGRDVVCRITLTGRGRLHEELKQPGAIDDLRQDVQQSSFRSPWVWIERLVDQTRPNRDLASRARQDDFLGHVLASMERTNPDDLVPLMSEVFTDRHERPAVPNESQLHEWLDEARWYVAELLEPEV